MKRHLRPSPRFGRKPLFFGLLGAEGAVGSALLLFLTYLATLEIIGDGPGHGLTGTDGEFWMWLDVIVKTGLFWLMGGVLALIYWPIFLGHLLFRAIRALWRLRRAAPTDA